jgi:hypothetical protein
VYGAHTTAADGLWSGLPLLTCPGESFASRVGLSLLRALPQAATGGEAHAAGSDGLEGGAITGPASVGVTHSLRDYEEEGAALAAAGPALLQLLRREIQAGMLAVLRRQHQRLLHNYNAPTSHDASLPLAPTFDADAYTAQSDRVARAAVDVRSVLLALARQRATLASAADADADTTSALGSARNQPPFWGQFIARHEHASLGRFWGAAGVPPLHLVGTEAVDSEES